MHFLIDLELDTPLWWRLVEKPYLRKVKSKVRFRIQLRWPNTVFARAFADAIQRVLMDCKKKTNMPSIERLFYLLKTCTICAIFLYNWTQRIDGFSLLLQRYVRKGKDAKNPAILSFFFVTERTQLNAAHA